MVETVGFVGLGLMGAPMASNLVDAGFAVKAYDLREQAVAALVAKGAQPARALGDLSSCDAVVVMVNTDAQAREVVESLIELMQGSGRTVLCMSTILPSTSRELGGKAASAGVELLEAPVSGGPVVAGLGNLAIMAGGDGGLFARMRPLLEAMGSAITHVGPLGAGLTVKLVNNMIAISTFPLVLEALRIGLEQGLDLETMVAVIKASSGNTWATDNWDQARLFLAMGAADSSQLDSLLATGRKDMELAAQLCRQEGIAAPLLDHSIEGLKAQLSGDVAVNIAAILRACSAG